ncbi:porin [Vibrio sp. YIC-376]|uniref:porin n=1 Tax=Vibrio sp. YIC-376 TaxID=3136162 RepID=UPI00402A655B
MKKYLITMLLSSTAFPSFATIELTDNLSLSGFGSVSWAKSDNDTPLLLNRFIEDENCFDCDTTFGIQLDYFYRELRSSVQVVKRPQDHWSDPQLEWAYLAYTYQNFDIYAGRLRLPLFLTSEYYYVGHAFTPARAPTEVYDSALGITAYNGLSIRWNHDLNDRVMMTAMPFVGFKDVSKITLNKNTELKVDIKDVVGLNLTLSGERYRWNFVYLNGNYDQTTTISNLEQSVPGLGTIAIDRLALADKDASVDLYSLSFRYELESFAITTESQTSDISTSWYAAASYNINQFTPYAIYGQQFDSSESKDGDSYLLGVRYDIDYNISLNAEWQYFNAFGDSLGAFTSQPNDTSANMYTIMLNFVF